MAVGKVASAFGDAFALVEGNMAAKNLYDVLPVLTTTTTT